MPTYRTLDYFNNATTGVFKDNTSGDIDAPHLQDFCQTAFGGLYVDTTAKTTDFTGTVGTLNIINANAITANLVVSEPAGIASGDRWGYLIQTQNTTKGASGFAQGPYWGVEPNNFLINNVTYAKLTTGTAKWGLLMDSECLIYQYVDATVGHQVIYDGRIAMGARYHKASDNATNESYATWVNIDVDTLSTDSVDVGGIWDSTNQRFDKKRAGFWWGTIRVKIDDLSTHEALNVRITDGTLELFRDYQKSSTTNEDVRAEGSGGRLMVAGGYLEPQFHNATTSGDNEIQGSETDTYAGVKEIF